MFNKKEYNQFILIIY